MQIIIDAMGGDNAPGAIVRGAVRAARELDVNVLLVGDKEKVESVLEETGHPSGLELLPSTEQVTMEDDPLTVLRTKRNASLPVAMRYFRENGDALISAGNTGTLMVAASHYVRPIKGIHRAAICALLPFPQPVLMLDCGANLGYHALCDVQWAIMGSLYMNRVMGMERPRVALLNNGTEACKGVPELVDAYRMLSERNDICFVGNVEARDLPQGKCDVLVTDGFTGNIVLKLLEGMGGFMKDMLRSVYEESTLTKLSFLAVKDPLRKKLSCFSSRKTGGAPILGLSKPVLKAHGNSDETAIFHAVETAMRFSSGGVIEAIRREADVFTQS